MKKKILLLMGIFSFGIAFAQIGIYTENPLGLFHVDAGRDNSATPTTTQLLNDVVAKVSSTGSINLGIGGVPSDNAQLDLLAANKGLLFNKVALTSKSDITTIAGPEKGMVVYNTALTSDLVEGYYYFDGSKWNIMRSSKVSGTTRLNLVSNGASIAVTPTAVSAGGYGGTRLSFTSTGSITINNAGRYVFIFNLYGSSTGGGVPGLYYLFLVKKQSATLMDGMTMTPVLQTSFSHPGCLAGTFEEGDEAEIYLAHASTNAVPWTLIANSNTSLPARTSMFYWKLY